MAAAAIAIVLSAPIAAHGATAPVVPTHAAPPKPKPLFSQGQEPLYYITLDGYPTQYGPKTMAFWSRFLEDMYAGILQGTNPGPATVLFVNSNDYSPTQYWALENAIARRTPGNPLCHIRRYCPPK